MNSYAMMNILLFLNIGGPEIIVLLFILGLPLILFLYALLDILKSEFKDGTTKLIWILIVLFAPVLGPLIYMVIGRNQKRE